MPLRGLFLAWLFPFGCIILTLVLNIAGVGFIGLPPGPDGPGYQIKAIGLFLFRITIPTIDDSVSSFEALLYLNNACLNPFDPYYDSAADAGPVCQRPRIAQTYIIRGSPNVIYPAICESEPASPSNTSTSPFYTQDQPCKVNQSDDTPFQITISTGASWVFLFFGAVSSLLTMLIVLSASIRKRLPSSSDIAATVCAAAFYFCASVAITADAARGQIRGSRNRASNSYNELGHCHSGSTEKQKTSAAELLHQAYYVKGAHDVYRICDNLNDEWILKTGASKVDGAEIKYKINS